MARRPFTKFWGFWLLMAMVVAGGVWWLFFRTTPVVEAPALAQSPLEVERRMSLAALWPLADEVKQLATSTGRDSSLWHTWMEPTQAVVLQHANVLNEAQTRLLTTSDDPVAEVGEQWLPQQWLPQHWQSWISLHRLLVLDGIRLLQTQDLEGLNRMRAARQLNHHLLMLGEWDALQAAATMAGEWALAMFALLPRDSYQAILRLPTLEPIHWSSALRMVLRRDLAAEYQIKNAWQVDNSNHGPGDEWHWFHRATFDLGSWLVIERFQRQAWVALLSKPLDATGASKAGSWWDWFDHAGSRHAADTSAKIWQPRIDLLRQQLAVNQLTHDMVRLRMSLFSRDQPWTETTLKSAVSAQNLRNPFNGEAYVIKPMACIHVDLTAATKHLPAAVWDALPLCTAPIAPEKADAMAL